MPWQPTTFLRFEESRGSSTRAARIVTDAGPAFIKVMGNPEGPHVLACEWVGSNLAKWLGLPTFDFALMTIDSAVDEIPLFGGGHASSGPAFVTRAMEGHNWGGGQDELQHLDNPDDITRLVVLDTWILNCDRHAPLAKRRPKRDNVFLGDAGGGRLRLVAMDHTHAFTCGRELTARTASIARVRDPNVYGRFPEFQTWIRKSVVLQTIKRLRQVDDAVVRPFIDGIPSEWGVGVAARSALLELICRRAAYVADNIPEKLYVDRTGEQTTLNFPEGRQG